MQYEALLFVYVAGFFAELQSAWLSVDGDEVHCGIVIFYVKLWFS